MMINLTNHSAKKNIFFERGRTESEIIQKNKELIKINAEKDKLLTIIAHDLRNPFNAIIGFSDMLVEVINQNDYSSAGQYAEIINQSSRQVMGLLTSLLEWSQSINGRINFNPEYFELIGLIDEVINFCSPNAEQKSITIRKTVHPNVLIFADKAMISSVLRNLICNSIKFSKQGGDIIISIRNSQSKLIVSVSDTGIGMSQTKIDKLFRIDEINSTSGTRNEQGTGLGLILCKEFIEKHGGRIWVDSVEGKGSTFSFSL